MKKIIAIIAAACFMCGTLSSAHGASADYLWGWESPSLGTTFKNGEDYVKRIYDYATGSYSAVLSQSGTSANREMLRQTVDYETGHKYTLTCFIRTEVYDANNLYFRCGSKIYGTTNAAAHKNGTNIILTGISFESNQSLSLGFIKSGKAKLYIDNVVIYDEEDSSKTNIVKNGDFETVVLKKENENLSGFPGWYSVLLGDSFYVSEDKYAERVYSEELESYVAKLTMYEGKNYEMLVQDISGLDPTHTYTLTCDIKCDVIENEWLRISVGDKKGTPYTPQRVEWIPYPLNGITFEETTGTVSFGIVGTGDTVLYIDNVVLYDEADDTKTNLIKNGDFDLCDRDILPVSVSAGGGADGNVNLLWEGIPDGLESIRIYNNSDGLLIGEVSPSDGEYSFNVSGSEYDITAVFIHESGTELSKNFKGICSKKYNGYVYGWDDCSTASEYFISPENTDGNNNCIRLENAGLSQNFSVGNGTYTAHFKVDGGGEAYVRLGDSLGEYTEPGEYTLTAEAPDIIEIGCVMGDVLFDSVRVCDSNGKNIIINGEFEKVNDDLMLPGLRIDNGIIRWDYPSEKIISVQVFGIESNLLLDELSPYLLSASGYDEEIYLNVLNSYEGYTRQDIYTGVHEYEINSPVLLYDGKTVTAQFNRKSTDSNMLLLCVYLDGRFHDLRSCRMIGSDKEVTESLKTNYIPDKSGEYTVKACLWNSFEEMKPLAQWEEITFTYLAE